MIGLTDIQQTWRSLWQQPANSLLIIAVLTLGMAGVIGMLSFVKSTVWDPLPFPNARQLVQVGWHALEDTDVDVDPLPGRDFLEWRKRMPAGVDLAGSSEATVNIGAVDGVERYDGCFVTQNLFAMLGVAPTLGRGFRAEDDQPGASLVVVISHELWQARFAGDPTIIGRSIRANAKPATIIGVMPPKFAFPKRQQVWLPAQLSANTAANQDLEFAALARPHAEGASTALMTALETWIADQRGSDPTTYASAEIVALPLADLYADAHTRALLGLMLMTVSLVLLVACANVANLMLARTLARSRDLAVRLTLGASRARVAAHLLGQSFSLTLIALALALPLARWGVDWVVQSFANTEDGLPPWLDFTIDPKLTLLALAVALLTALIVGLVPVARLRVDALGSALRDGGRSVAGGGIGKLSKALVAGELALSCVVLLATLVMVRGVDDLARADLGIETGHLLTARIALFEADYPTDAQATQFFQRLTDTLRAEPGVADAGAGTALPGLLGYTERMQPEGFDGGAEGPPWVRYAAVDPHFVSTYAIELRAGRSIDSRDRADSDPVVVIDERFAHSLFAEADPLGRRVRIPAQGDDARWYTVIGVIENLQLEDVGDDLLPTVLIPLTQSPQRFVSVVMRTEGDPAAFKPRFLELLRAQDPDTPAYWLRSYDEVLYSAMVGERVLSGMFSAFGLVALVLSSAGLYGLIAQLVSQRTREIGVQRALGASHLHILRGLLSSTVTQVGIGLVLGIGLAIPFTRLITSVLPVLTLEPTAILALAAILTTVSLVATLIPAWRALSVDPTVALRNE